MRGFGRETSGILASSNISKYILTKIGELVNIDILASPNIISKWVQGETANVRAAWSGSSKKGGERSDRGRETIVNHCDFFPKYKLYLGRI